MKIRRIPTEQGEMLAMLSRQDIRDLRDALEIAISASPGQTRSELVDEAQAEDYFRQVAWKRLSKVLRKAAR